MNQAQQAGSPPGEYVHRDYIKTDRAERTYPRDRFAEEAQLAQGYANSANVEPFVHPIKRQRLLQLDALIEYVRANMRYDSFDAHNEDTLILHQLKAVRLLVKGT